ncbi:iron complex transport system permease protein [Paenibacillus turicensis]|uniref:Iron complex transport system permease protein n=1 Tax=Paenibacillus turicensis TaxID=160487 RepID=A0ABS4FVX9_9BACL|nr:iron chelate uptake ABC transporter family permease subunit [Paenibacillus turicensis]MBP1906738.1 iron complex transport system permease protein [Paenibacillus turicensis]
MNVNTQHQGKRYSLIKNMLGLLVLLILLVLMALLNIGVGSVPLSVSEVIAAFGAHANPDHQVIVMDYRLVRTLLGMMVGAALGVAGVVAQAILYNPLASPGTLGITAGSGVGAVMIVMLVPQAATGLVSAAAFTGGVLAATVIYLVAYRGGVDAIRLALVGVAVSALCGAGINLLLVSGDANLSTALVWLAGSLWGRDWIQFYSLLPWVVVLIPVTWCLSRQMEVLQLGDETAQGLGVRIQVLRVLLLAIVVALAGAAVSTAGTIGFVGLICPHIARGLVGNRYSMIIPVAAVCGALLVITADFLGRVAHPPLEIPAGIVTAVIGAPYFIYLMWRSSRKG